MAGTNQVIDKPYQIICEGPDDIDFFCRLIRDRNIAGYQVSCGRNPENNKGLGKDGFGPRIDALKSSDIVKGYIVVADCDDQPSARFESAARHLENQHLPRPRHALEIARNDDGIQTAIIMIPSEGVEGGLETLLLRCSSDVTTHAECRTAFCACVEQNRREIDKDKLKLRTLICATHAADPGLSLSFWLANENRPFPMTHSSLDEIANFLTEFASGLN